jgi:adenine deaminase
MKLSGNIVDVLQQTIFPGTITIRNGYITSIERETASYDTFLLPGFIDAHVHIESSLVIPSEFARLAAPHGTVGTVSDPHEIANVLGITGVHYMIENARKVPFKFNFGAPSCVPATPFETSGATIDLDDLTALLDLPAIRYLSEMMNVPGVVNQDPAVHQKLAAARERGKPIDGHAPGLRGDKLRAYVAAGISTDHEAFEREEGLEKLRAGMLLAIREGSAARNFDELIDLLDEYPGRCMFCSDDKHPDSLVEGHIDNLVRRALRRGFDRMDVLRTACVTPVRHYDLDVGLLREGDPADLIEINNFDELEVIRTFINGELVAEKGETCIERVAARTPNRFNATPLEPSDLLVEATSHELRVIEAIDGQLVTRSRVLEPTTSGDYAIADPERDILKLTVVNRYQEAPPAVGFITGFGLTGGALASSVAHDSHNIVAVGTGDEEICRAVNALIDEGGGLSLVDGTSTETLALPVAGLMSNAPGQEVAAGYTRLERQARNTLSSTLSSPYMTLSFMALLVIPELKLSDKGLFDGEAFQFTSLFV